MYDNNKIKSFFVDLIRNNSSINMVYRMDFGKNKGTLAFIDSGKEAKQVECNILGFEAIGRMVREAFEEVHGKSELVSSTMRREEFQAKTAILVLHPYWKLGIFEIAIKS